MSSGIRFWRVERLKVGSGLSVPVMPGSAGGGAVRPFVSLTHQDIQRAIFLPCWTPPQPRGGCRVPSGRAGTSGRAEMIITLGCQDAVCAFGLHTLGCLFCHRSRAASVWPGSELGQNWRVLSFDCDLLGQTTLCSEEKADVPTQSFFSVPT